MGFAIALGIVLVPGTIWAMTRQARFQLSHLMLGMLTFCALLVPLKWVLIDQEQMSSLFFFFAITLVPLIAGGILVGVANEKAVPEGRHITRRIFFFAGFLCPLAILPFIGSTMMLLFIEIHLELRVRLIAIWLVSALSIGITVCRGQYALLKNRS